jgi:hypothetical protein
MKTVRIIPMVMLAFLYLGGTVGHLSGTAFPIIGSGDKSLDHFEGKTKDPVRPTIADCRHIPLVKSVVVPTLFAVTQPVIESTEEFQVVAYPSNVPSLFSSSSESCRDRAPPGS